MVRVIPYVIVFLVGFASAWLFKKPVTIHDDDNQPVVRASQYRSKQSQKTPDKANANQARVDELLKKYADSGYDEDLKDKARKEATTKELLQLIEAISQNAGITGLDYEQQDQLKAYLLEWCDRDADAALVWANSIKNVNDREELLGKVIDHIAKSNFSHAIELAQQYCREDDGAWNLPYELQSKIVEQDVDHMLETVSLFISKNGSSSLHGLVFPSKYDYRKALDGIAAIKATLKERESLAVMPNDLLKNWAKSDSQAAWAWLNERQCVNDENLREFLEGYSETGSTEQNVTMMLQMSDKFKREDNFCRSAWMIMCNSQNPDFISQFIKNQSGDIQKNWNKLFDVSRYSSGGSYDVAKGHLLSQMTPTQRMAVFSREESRELRESEQKFYEPILQTDLPECVRLFLPCSLDI